MTKRNYGIDLLRMILMLMVVILHVLGHGGVLEATNPLSAKYCVSWLIESFAYCAVNCYALISGYVHFNSRYRLSSIARMWFQALLYSLGIAVCVWILKPDTFSIRDLITFLLPVSRGMWWYLSAYVGLFLLIPFLNAGINVFTEKQTKIYLFVLFFAFTAVPTFVRKDTFATNSGYSTFWLAYLYVIGACIKKYEWGGKLKSRKAVIIYIFSVLLSWGMKLFCESFTMRVLGEPKTVFHFVDYTSPTMVIAAISLLFVFMNCSIPEKMRRFISTFSPAAFGVYLIHTHWYVWDNLIDDRFHFLTDFNVLLMIIGIIGWAGLIFFVCLLIDWVRLKIFKLVRVAEFFEKLEERIRCKVTIK